MDGVIWRILFLPPCKDQAEGKNADNIEFVESNYSKVQNQCSRQKEKV